MGKFLAAIPALMLLLPPLALAQSGSAIVGIVRDTTGAVLPGVTVEASSPALIEKVRTAVTDGQGLYRIVDLRPGAYVVTFTLPGFNITRREGIELTASFTASVNADMRVGALEETVTVTGQAPTVDVQNVVSQRVMTRDVIDAIPTGTKSAITLGVLIPGMTTISQDVGGTVYGSAAIAIHGSRAQEMQLLHDGMMYNNGQGRGGSFTAIATNDATVQEISIETGGLSAESELGGVRTNVIPKEGGNTFRGSFFGTFTNSSLQSHNLSDELIARGLQSVDRVNKIYDINPALGGPIVADRMWFFGSIRAWKTEQTIAGMFFNGSPIPHRYEPDLSRPAYEGDTDGNVSLRLTWQVAPRHKLNAQQQTNRQIRDHFYGQGAANRLRAPDASLHYNARPSYLSQVGWNSPMTSRVLFEAGAAFANKDYHYFRQPYIDPNAPSFVERSTGISWGNLPGEVGHNSSHNFNTRFAMSYVTGSHSARIGMTFMRASSFVTRDVANGGIRSLQLLNGVPNRVQVVATPLDFREVTKANVGIFAQDQWTVRQLTLNVGVRFDYLNNYVPVHELGPGPQVPDRQVTFPAVYGVPDWKNVSPRLGASYDLFGNGRTALKFSVGRYLEGPNLTTITRLANPAGAIVSAAFRNWTDVNGDFTAQEEELGPVQNVNFGQSIVSSRYADDALTTRGFNWETSAAIQHELISRVSMNVGYHRRWYGNFRATDNLLRTPADYDPYCVTAPVDSRLPNGGGYEVCGLFDVRPNVAFLSDNVVTMADNFGKQREVYSGVDVSVSARLPNGIVLSGGTSTGRVMTDSCFVVDSPQELLNCKVTPPFHTQLKLLGVLPLPGGVQASATFQSLPGSQILANYVVSSAAVVGSLGRNLSTGTATVPLLEPGTRYGDRLNQLDFRVAKSFPLGQGRRIQGLVDLYNMFNASPVLNHNNSFGSAWQRPTQILHGRLLKAGVQVDF